MGRAAFRPRQIEPVEAIDAGVDTRQKNEEKKLANCYRNSLQLAVENNCKSIAFPSISTGIYRFPKDKAAQVAVNTTIDFLLANDSIEKIIFVCFDDENFNELKKVTASQ